MVTTTTDATWPEVTDGLEKLTATLVTVLGIINNELAEYLRSIQHGMMT
jgi:hypothetical protein